MEFGVSLLHEGNPKLSLVVAVTVERSLRLSVVGNSRVYNDVLPSSILEELEHGETVLDSVIHDQVVQEIRIRALNQKRAEQPAVSKDTLLDVTWSHLVSEHAWFLVLLCEDLLWSFPLNHRHVHSVVRWIDWVIVQRLVACREL